MKRIFKYPIMIISRKKRKSTDVNTMSERDNMQNIDYLTSQVGQLNTWFTFWNNWSTVFVIATIVAGGLLYFTQYKANKTAILLGKAKDVLSEFNNKVQALEIEKVREDAKERITHVKTEADKEIALLNSKTANANEAIAKANENAEELRKQNLELESRLEKERTGRIEMEAAIAPRVMEQRQSAKEIEQFQGISVIIESLAESEPWRTAGQIAYILDKAKWNVLPGMKRFLDATMFFDGVTIETNVGARPREDRSSKAADALVAVLIKNNIQSHRMPSIDVLPLNTIKIRVGLKPAGYFERDRKDPEYGNKLYK